MKILIPILFLTSLCFAQEAPVLELSSTDAAQAQALWNAKQAADKAWDKFNAQIVKSYTVVPRDWPTASSFSIILLDGDGWTRVKGFEAGEVQYSKDFRFIVPKATEPHSSVVPCTWISSGALAVGPSY